ncbi:MAG TPA: hypothetical protein V6D17_12725 [Candidatus Obscuribacterales bacterium]
MKFAKQNSLLVTALAVAGFLSGGLCANAASPPSSPDNVSASDSEPTETYVHSTGVSFSYPKGWKVEKHPDKDTLVKVSSERAACDISLSASDNELNLRLTDWLNIVDRYFLSKLPGFKELSREYVLIGRHKNIPALSRQLKLTYQGYPVRQQQVLIPAEKRIYNFAFTQLLIPQQPNMMAWAQTLSSIELPQQMVSYAVSALPEARTAPRKDAADVAACGNIGSCPLYVTARPNPALPLEQKIEAVLPRKEEERWLQVPWECNLTAARARAQQQHKPLFVWSMDGNVLGAT